MGNNILTAFQKTVLGALSTDEFIIKTFFLTGGTALSEFYFQHRLSEDFDFFTENQFDSKRLISSLSNISDKLKLSKIEQQSLTGQQIFFVYHNSDTLKIDFAYFPFKHLGVFTKTNNLKVSSVEDICINKIHAITTRQRARDYFDLYFCIPYLKWTPKDLINNYRLKFDVSLPVEQIATSFTNVLDAEDLPQFLGSTPWEKVQEYFLQLANDLKGEILER